MLVLLGVPLAGAVASVFRGPPEVAAEPTVGSTQALHDGLVALRTLGIPLLIGALATVLAWPAAWIVNARPRGWWLAGMTAAAPLFLPTYLLFAALRLSHAPGTPLGRWLAPAPAWVHVTIDQTLAIIGLAFWSAPLAACVLLAGLRRVPLEALQSLRLDGGSIWARARMTLALMRTPFAVSVALVGVVMLGSAVPLHLAGVDTPAQRLWWRLQLAPTGAVLVDALPLLAPAVLAALLITAHVGRRPDEQPIAPPRAGRVAWLGWVAVSAVSLLVPLGCMLGALRLWSSIPRFWEEASDALAESLWIAASAGALITALAALSWWVASARAGATLRLLAAAFVTAGLLPGVLIGAGVLQALSLPGLRSLAPTLEAGGVPLVLAHGARFGFIGVLAGCFLARSEPRDHRDARHLDGAVTLRAWWRASASPLGSALAGVFLVTAALSFQEIESAVIVATPGQRTLPQVLLELLHYNRDEQLAAAGIGMLALGLAPALGGAALLLRSARRPEPLR